MVSLQQLQRGPAILAAVDDGGFRRLLIQVIFGAGRRIDAEFVLRDLRRSYWFLLESVYDTDKGDNDHDHEHFYLLKDIVHKVDKLAYLQGFQLPTYTTKKPFSS